MAPRDALIAHIKRLKTGGPRPVVSLEEFFEGNENYGSIGCNLDVPYVDPVPPGTSGWLARMFRPGTSPPQPPYPAPTAPHPGPQGFYQLLRKIRAREDVQDVLVEISDADLFVDTGSWPFSECIYVLTKADRAEVAAWVAPLFPDTVEEKNQNGRPTAAPELLPGFRVYELWWD